MDDPTRGYKLVQQGTNLASAPPFHYRYPLTKLDSSDDYLKITVLNYTPPGFESPSGTFALPSAGEVGGYDKVSEKGTIILPIPDSVQDMNGATWGTSEIGPVAALAFRAGQSVLSEDGLNKIQNNLFSSIGSIGEASKVGTTQKFIQALLINKATNTLLGQSRSQEELASRFAGVISNSNVELIFNSVNIRSPFSFGFDIVPRSQKEAEMVRNIIRKLKQSSAAKKSIGAATGLFLKAPDVFKIEYMNGSRTHPYLNRFKICALQSMSVNYAPSGTYATYSDSAPVNMNLSLSFQELTPIYAEDYDQGIGTEGMGY